MTEMTEKNGIIQRIRDTLPEYMDEFRLSHTLGVWEECRAMGELFGAFSDILSPHDRIRLEIAGLLHDISKEQTTEQQLRLCKEYGVEPDRYETASPSVLHQTTGAYLARELFGTEVVDDVIFGAISCHTTGKEHMTPFDCMLFLADYIEAGRKFSRCAAARRAFYEKLPDVKGDREKLLWHLGDSVIGVLDETLTVLLGRSRLIDSRTVKCRNDLLWRRSAAGETGKSLFSVY